ncbi:MAG: glycosyltransferase family 4 protein [Rhizobiaceae bacterium]
MRIALGIHRLTPRGGLEDHAIRIGEELERRGHAVTLFSTNTAPALTLPVQLIQAPGRSNHARMAGFGASLTRATANSFDRVVGFQPLPGLDVLFLADHLRDRPGLRFWKRLLPRHRTYARLERACFGEGSRTRIMGLARPQMRAFAERYPESLDRTVVLPPSITESKRRPQLRRPELRDATRRRLQIGDSTPVWLWLGLQPRIKGLDRAIDALALVPEAVLLVGGIAESDERAAALVRQAARLGVAGRIRWLGYLSGDALFSTFAASDALAHPSRVDVTAAVILEALVNGLPVVATAECGFADHIEESGAGRVVPTPFVTASFAHMLQEVCGPANVAMSSKGIDHGRNPALYSGISAACDLIEAEVWPRELTLGGGM